MSYQQYVNQLRPRNKTYISKVDKVKNIISEGKINSSDIFKRDNKDNFIKKAISGELLDTDGKKISAIDSNSDLIKHLRGTNESSPEVNNLIKTAFGKSLTNLSIDKPTNGVC